MLLIAASAHYELSARRSSNLVLLCFLVPSFRCRLRTVCRSAYAAAPWRSWCSRVAVGRSGACQSRLGFPQALVSFCDLTGVCATGRRDCGLGPTRTLCARNGGASSEMRLSRTASQMGKRYVGLSIRHANRIDVSFFGGPSRAALIFSVCSQTQALTAPLHVKFGGWMTIPTRIFATSLTHWRSLKKPSKDKGVARPRKSPISKGDEKPKGGKSPSSKGIRTRSSSRR